MHHNPLQAEALCRSCRNCPTCLNFFCLCVSLKLIPSLLQFSPLRGIVLTTALWQHLFPKKQIVPGPKSRVRLNEVFASTFNPLSTAPLKGRGAQAAGSILLNELDHTAKLFIPVSVDPG